MPISTIDSNGLTNPLTSGVTTNTITSAASTALTLKSAGTTAVTIDTSQNTTFAGNTTVSKAQAIQSVTSTTGTNSVYTQYTNTSGSAYVGINNSTGADFGNAAYALQVYHAGAYPIVFATSNTERMRIDSSGVVRINNTSNATYAAQLNVQFPNTLNTGIYIKVTNTNTTNSMIIFGNTNNDAVGSISTSGSATAYNTSSDYRLKNNITPMTGALAKVAQLKPVTYKWNADDSYGEGFIAHELAEVCPLAVYGEKDAVNEDGSIHAQGIDTSFLVATLTAALQETKALIDQQAETINALTARIVALEAK